MGPRPAGFGAWAPYSENKNTCCFRPLHDSYRRYVAPQAKFCGPDTSKVPIPLNIDDKSCVLAHPMESDVAMHTYFGSIITGRMFHCPLHDRYVRYIISCTRSVAIVVAPPGPWALFSCFCFPPPPRLLRSARPPTYRELNSARPGAKIAL